MKKINKFSLLLFFISLSIVINSCTPEETENPTPTDERDKFVGAWNCSENSSLNGKSTFTVDINKSNTEKSQVILENFYNYGFNKTAIATISGNKITIPSQTFSGTNTLSGSGTLSADGKKIEYLNYVVNDGSVADTCKAVLTKQ